MRIVLIDWLIEVAEEYRLQDQTIFLAVSYLEHCLAKPVKVTRDTLQLLGITCLFVAAYENTLLKLSNL
jgi:cyclin A